MKPTTNITTRILAAHLLVLVVVITVVVFASREVYRKARQQSIEQAKQRQAMLATQTARAIEQHYASIISTLDLMKPASEDPKDAPLGDKQAMFQRLNSPPQRGDRARPDGSSESRPDSTNQRRLGGGPGRDPGAMQRRPLSLAPLLWAQLRKRGVANLFEVQRPGAQVLGSFPREDTQEAQEIALRVREWMRNVEGPSISAFGNYGGSEEHPEWGHLLCVVAPNPAGAEGKVLIVAVVPVDEIEHVFLDSLNKSDGDATLVDESGTVLASRDKDLVGKNLAEDATHPRYQQLVRQYVPAGISHTELVPDEQPSGSKRHLPARLLQAEPIKVAGKNWSVLLSVPLSSVDVVVADVFQKAAFWAGSVILIMTGLLFSTSTVMIRQRLRLERMKNELLGRELQQARQIQLAWLPDNNLPLRSATVAAVNQPASHISGDFYDWFDLADGRIVVTIGDVSGHGISAAFLMATAQLSIRTLMGRGSEPGKCLEDVNRLLCSQAFAGQFVTALVLVIDPAQQTVAVASAGHFPPLLSDGASIRSLEMETQLVLGVDSSERYPTTRFNLPPHFTLVLYTDGVVEAAAPGGERFSGARLHSSLEGKAGSPEVVIQTVVNEVRRFCGNDELADDLTLVAIQSHRAPVRASKGAFGEDAVAINQG